MTISDPIADMLTRIRNAGHAKFKSVDIPGSVMKIEIAKVLKEEGYIKNFKVVQDNKQGILRVYLKYVSHNQNAILSLDRVSKPSRRVYMRRKDLKPYLDGTGIVVLSTSKGIMTDQAARKANVGGEILCRVW